MTKITECPDCEEQIIIPDDSEVGEIIECQNCGAEMEILSLNPPQVSLIIEEK